MATTTSTVNFVFESTDKTGNILGGIANGFKTLGVAAAAATGAAVAGLTAFAASGVKAAMDMETQMSNIAAVMGTTKSEIQPLSDLIKDLGLDPNLKVDATEAGQAIELLARNGLNMSQILDGAARSTVLLANATGAEFGAAADIATDTMTIFNIQAAEMNRAVDGIVSVTTNSKFTIDDFRLALANGGAVAASAGVSFDDFNTAIAALAPQFSSGMTAGTGLKNLLLRLVPSTEPAKEAMAELGLITEDGANKFFDASGNMRSMADISQVLQDALGGLSDAQRTAALRTIFGNDAMGAAIGLANVGSEAFNELQDTMAQTSAVDSAAERMDNLAGALEILQGIIDTIRIEVGTAFIPMLKNLAQRFSELAEQYAPDIISAFQGVADWLGERLPAAVEWLIGKFIALRDWFVQAIPIISAFVSGTLVPLYNRVVEVATAVGGWVVTQFNALRDWFVSVRPQIQAFIDGTLRPLFSQLREGATVVGGWIIEQFNRLREWFTTARPQLDTFIERIRPLIDAFMETATSIKDFLLRQLAKFQAWFIENEPLIRDFAEVVGTAIGAISYAVITFWSVAEPILEGFIDTMLNVAKLIMQIATGDWAGAWQTMGDIVEIQVTASQSAMTAFANWVTNFFGTDWQSVTNTWRNNWELFKSIPGLALDNIVGKIDAWVWQVKSAMWNVYYAFKDKFDAIARLPYDMFTGFISTANNMAWSVINALTSPIQSAVWQIKQLLGIASPSKVFADIGNNVGLGLIQGMAGQSGNVIGAAQAMAAGAIQSAQSTVNNFNLTVNSSANTEPILQDFAMMQQVVGFA